MTPKMNRRFFLRGLIAAPAIVAASSIMPVKLLTEPAVTILPTEWLTLNGIWRAVAIHQPEGGIVAWKVIDERGPQIGDLVEEGGHMKRLDRLISWDATP